MLHRLLSLTLRRVQHTQLETTRLVLPTSYHGVQLFRCHYTFQERSLGLFTYSMTSPQDSHTDGIGSRTTSLASQRRLWNVSCHVSTCLHLTTVTWVDRYWVLLPDGLAMATLRWARSASVRHITNR